MAAPTSTFLSYAAKGNREDLSDVIYNVDPYETPFLTGIGRSEADSTKFEWQTQALAAASTDNAVLEGDDATTDATTATVRRYNYCQIQDKVARVSGTQRAVNTAGRKDELAYQVYLKTLELRRDMEKAVVGLNTASAVGDATTPRKLGSVLSWIATNDVIDTTDTGAVSPTGDGTDTRTDGTQRALTEALLKLAFKNCWDNGGDPDCVMVGSFNKQVISGFTGGATKTKEIDDRTLVAAIDYYESDFGIVEVIPNRFMRTRDCLVLQKDMWEAAFLRPVHTVELAKTGDSDRRQLIVEWTLQASNEKASGGVFDLTTS